ncbi:hypothetical protein WG899_01305 [Paucibacter sp. AS339]|uniref:hypothetical protein n=1 Tax=Paucibacter hankyongi TaxID=3133434 RepID=UPI0030B603D4
MMKNACLTVIVASAVTTALMSVPQAANAAEAGIKVQQVHFKKGASSTTIKGSIKGDETIDYKLRTGAGQVLQVAFKPSNPSSYFNLLPPGSEGEAIHIGSSAGNDFKLNNTVAGDYTVRVYLMRNAARRNEHSNYILQLGVTNSGK